MQENQPLATTIEPPQTSSATLDACPKAADVFFVYGTLLDEDILRAVLNRTVCDTQMQYGTIAGYQKFTYPGDTFPILIPSPAHSVEGALLFDLSEQDLLRIDFYEGDEYGYAKVEAQLNDGTVINALYNKAADEEIKSDVLWTLDYWQQHEKPQFIGYVERYMALYGTMSIDEADVVWRNMVDAV